MQPVDSSNSAPPKTSPRIFVSHSHKDQEFCLAFVSRLRQMLSLGDPEDVFYDETDVQAGDTWLPLLQREVVSRPIFIVVLSPNSVVSQFVRAETNLALDLAIKESGRTVIPVVIEDCDVTTLAPLLRTYQWVDFAHKPAETAYAQLIQKLQSAHATVPVSKPLPSRPTTTQPGGTPGANAPRPMLAAIALAAIIVLAVALFIILKTHSGPGSPTAKNTQVPATATSTTERITSTPATSLLALYTQQGQHVVSDPLNQSGSYPWGVFSGGGGYCTFTNGAYRAGENNPDIYTQCLLRNSNYSDFLFQAKVQILAGDSGGLVFWANKSTNIEYHFDITAGGEFDLVQFQLTSQGTLTSTHIVPLTLSNTIHTGFGAINLLQVLTYKNVVYLYVNTIPVYVWLSPHSSSGAIGFLAYDNSNATTVVAQDADVWTAPPGY